MKRWRITSQEHILYTVTLEAETKEEALELYENGNYEDVTRECSAVGKPKLEEIPCTKN